MARLPTINNNTKVCVICEGQEDTAYFKRLLELNVWNSVYSFFPVNAFGASKIPARFQDAFQNNKYDLVLVFCDTDKAPYREYTLLKKRINSFLNKQKASDKLVIFANPCTMQIILSHFGDVSLKNQGKKTNADIIEQFTGVKDYDAHDDQIKEICSKIFRRTYSEMKRRVEAINCSDTVSCSTNFSIFLDRFEQDDRRWVSAINQYLED